MGLGSAARVRQGMRQIVFDEPELFHFVEKLVSHERFPAGLATTWYREHDWPRIRALLENLIVTGLLQPAREADAGQRRLGDEPEVISLAPVLLRIATR